MTSLEPLVQGPGTTQPGSLKSFWEKEDSGWEKPSSAVHPHTTFIADFPAFKLFLLLPCL